MKLASHIFLLYFLFLDKCLINGRSYNLGEDFVSADCTGYCKCKEGGVVLCVSLCPPEAIKCQHHEKTIELSRKVPNSDCTCPTWRCLKRQGIQLFKKRQGIFMKMFLLIKVHMTRYF